MRHCLNPWANIQGRYLVLTEDAGVASSIGIGGEGGDGFAR